MLIKIIIVEDTKQRWIQILKWMRGGGGSSHLDPDIIVGEWSENFFGPSGLSLV